MGASNPSFNESISGIRANSRSGCGSSVAEPRLPSRPWWKIAWLFLFLTLTSYAIYAAETFKRLSAAEIPAVLVAKIVTDEAHWSDHYLPEGKLKYFELGNQREGTWKVVKKELCLTRRERRKTTTDCFEVWLRQDQIEYRRDSVAVVEASLRNQ